MKKKKPGTSRGLWLRSAMSRLCGAAASVPWARSEPFRSLLLMSLPRRAIARLFFFRVGDGIRHPLVTGVQTCALPISAGAAAFGGAPAPRHDDRQARVVEAPG